jgi:hypothetical protein
MTTQLHLAYGIVDGRAWADQDRALLRTVELARQDDRRARRTQRALARRRIR